MSETVDIRELAAKVNDLYRQVEVVVDELAELKQRLTEALRDADRSAEELSRDFHRELSELRDELKDIRAQLR